MGRSEKNAVGNTKFSDLNLTRYPNAIDTRANNVNMKGFINLGEAGAGETPDINYAEHINASLDGLMAVQRTLGINPQGTKADVVTRLNDFDNHNHDARYGGSGWILSQTLVGHTHTGQPGHPSKINLVSEVQGLLKKSNLDLSATGLTGADIRVSAESDTKISVAIDDKLSTSAGGTIQKDLQVKGRFASRIERHWTVADAQNGATNADATTSGNSSKRGSGVDEVRFISEYLREFEYGKYVIGVRLKTSALLDENVAYIGLYNKVGGTWDYSQRKWLSGADFKAANKWTMFYFVVDVEGDSLDSFPIIRIAKDTTSVSVNVDFDYAYIMPVHPAVFDR